MPFDSSFGTLSRLPPEIRLQIWDHFSLHPFQREATDQTPARPTQPRLAFLQTSQRIHDEASTHLYKNATLRFQISPQHQHRSWLTVRSSASNGASWQLEDLNDAISRGFMELPYEKLKGVYVEIDAPCRRDPGQIFCLWQKCLELAGMLEQSHNSLPDLEVYLNDSALAAWCDDGEPQKSLVVDRPTFRDPTLIDWWCEVTDIDSEDYVIVLKAFQKLCSAQTARIYLPYHSASGSEFVSNIETLISRKESSGTRSYPVDARAEKCIQDDLDDMHMDLDLALDILPGATAAMLRLERFSSWYVDGLGSESRYEKTLERIFKAQDDSRFSTNPPRLVQLRYEAMQAFNPRSLFHRYGSIWRHRWIPNLNDKARDHLFKSTGVKSIKEAVKRGCIEEEFDRESWHSGIYPEGIPPFDSAEFYWKLWGAGDQGHVSGKYKQDFVDKLQAWGCDDDWEWSSDVVLEWISENSSEAESDTEW